MVGQLQPQAVGSEGELRDCSLTELSRSAAEEGSRKMCLPVRGDSFVLFGAGTEGRPWAC